ncbi:FRG domain-containing protein [Flavobacterium sp.]|uniref:FRG domain-containing protein n=1 Tax=Flavobacterium sp. TaxID=239 RepID=UPI00326758BA
MNNNYIETVEDFQRVINEIQNNRVPVIGEKYQEIYRGQSKDSYKLQSGIARYAKSSLEIEKLEKKIVNSFKKLIEDSKDPKKFIQLCDYENDYENEWRWLEQMQHYGLPTRLLDWSLDPKIALYFAIESNIEDVGQFWIFKSPLNWLADDHFKINPFSKDLDIISNSRFYLYNNPETKIAEHRRFFQDGKFTIQDYQKSIYPLEKQFEISNKLIKYLILPKAKKILLEYLENFNINNDSVYIKFDPEIENLISLVKQQNKI